MIFSLLLPNGNLEEHNSAVTTAQESFDEKKADLIEQFSDLASLLQEQLGTLDENFSSVAEESDSKKQDLETSFDSLAEGVTSAIASKFAEEVMEELTGSSEGLTQAFSALDNAGGEMGDQLKGSIGEIVDKISEVTDLIEEVRPVLETAKSLLG